MARQAATKSFLVWFDALMAALLAAYSELHSATVFANAGALGNAEQGADRRRCQKLENRLSHERPPNFGRTGPAIGETIAR